MATTGKKGRKVKGKTFVLSEFLAEDNDAPQAGYAIATASKKTMDWAAEMENEQLDDKYTIESAGPKDKFILPTGPRATREPMVDPSKIPSKPPYTAFIANLPYDIDQEDIQNFFKKLKVKSVRLPRDGGEAGRVKGFGYADFDDRDSLIEALSMNDEQLKGRKIRIHVADSQESEREGNRNERRDDGTDRTIGDWRSAPREESSFASREDKYRNGSDRFSERNERYSDRDRYSHDRGFSRGFESSGFGGYGSDRERGNSMDRGYSSSERDRQGGDRFRDRDRDRYDKFNRGGFDRNDRSGRSGRRDFGSDFRNDRDRYNDRYDDGGRGGGRTEAPSFERFERGASYDRDIDKETPKARKKLVLAPRSVPIESQNASTSAIFGGAKPVDTAAIDRKIEERLEKEKKSVFKEGETEKKEKDKWDRNEENNENLGYENVAEDTKSNKSDDPEMYPLRRRSTESRSRSSNSLNSGTQEPSNYNECASQSEPEDDKSERGRYVGKPPSPRKEEGKPLAAPQSRENVWQKRTGQEGEKENKQYHTVPRTKRSSSISSNNSDKERGRRSSFDRPPSGRRQDGDSRPREDSRGRRRDDYQYRDDSASRRRSDYDKQSDRQGGRGGNRGGSNRKERVWVRHDPNPRENSHERIQDKGRQKEKIPKELPKFEEQQKVASYTTKNKFSLLNEDEDHRGSGSD